MINQSDFGGVYLGTTKGEEIIPGLIECPGYWMEDINQLIRRLVSISPFELIDRHEETAQIMNDFYARNRFGFRVNLVFLKVPREVYSGHDREYLNRLFYHDLGWINWHKDEGALVTI